MLSDVEVKKNLIHGAEQGVIRRLPEVAKFQQPNLEAFLRDFWGEWEAKFQKDHPDSLIVKLVSFS
jgi:hypothetical protein